MKTNGQQIKSIGHECKHNHKEGAMKKLSLGVAVGVFALGLTVQAYAFDPDVTVSVTTPSTFSLDVVNKKGKASDGTCCEGGDVDNMSFATSVVDGHLTAAPFYSFLSIATAGQEYLVKITGTNPVNANSEPLPANSVSHQVVFAQDFGGNAITGDTKATAQNPFTATGAVTYTSSAAGTGGVIQSITNLVQNGTTPYTGAQALTADTPAGTYTGQITYSLEPKV